VGAGFELAGGVERAWMACRLSARRSASNVLSLWMPSLAWLRDAQIVETANFF